MLLMELTEQKGTYAAVRFDQTTIDVLTSIIEDNKIPNGLNPDEFHSTTCFSRKHLKGFKPLGKIDPPWIAKPLKFGTFPMGDKTCAILFYECNDQSNRFDYICKEYGATWDYDKYECHITLSYNIDNYDMKKLDIKKIPELTIISEYTEELDLNKYK